MQMRPDRTDSSAKDGDALSYCRKITQSFRSKADHNKHESQITFAIVVGASLVAPLFVTLGIGTFWGKIVPAIISVSAAIATSWLQLRQPQRLWALYRQAQRRLENHQLRHRYKITPYDTARDPDKLLATATATLALEFHYRWEGLIPDPDSIETLTNEP